MRIDAHQHFWTFAGHEDEYDWMTGDYSVLGQNFNMDMLLPLLNLAGFDGTIAVQAREMALETDYLLQLADSHREILGVVGWLDLCSPNVDLDLERYAKATKLKGLRMLIHDRPDPEFAISEAHVNGVSKLAQFGLTYDLLLKPPHLPAAIRLVDRFPNQQFVVDHIAKPDIQNRVLEPWRDLMLELGKRPNVYCKLSSVITQANWASWTDAAIFPFLDVSLEACGVERIMVGSDWPVSTVATDYVVTMGLFERWSQHFSQSEKAAFMGDNCARFYGVDTND